MVWLDASWWRAQERELRPEQHGARADPAVRGSVRDRDGCGGAEGLEADITVSKFWNRRPHCSSFMESHGFAGPGVRGEGAWLTLDKHGPCSAAKCYRTREGRRK